MKTVTYSQVVQLAATLAGRFDDTTSGTALRLPPSEASALLLFLAAELPDLWTREAWPELCDHLESVSLDAEKCFDTREGDADEMGDVLAVLEADASPLTTTIGTALPPEKWSRLDDRVNVRTLRGSVWVDWQTPAPELLAVPAVDLDDYELPARFKLPLAARAAALLIAEEDPQRAAALRAVAEEDVRKHAARLRRPWWRQ